MNILDSLVIIAVAALIHASFQLSVSVLTLLSSHTIGARASHARLVALTGSYTVGVFVMTVLIISTVALLLQLLSPWLDVTILWVSICGLLLGLGAAVWIFYYRKEQGTALWLPRGMARYLSDRTKATKQTSEAFGLGVSSVLAELLFIIGPMVVAALVLVQLDRSWQLVGIGLYAALSLSPLLIVYALVGSGHRLSHIQRWREQNKSFLQFIAGSSLVVLGFFLYVDQVLEPTAIAAASGY